MYSTVFNKINSFLVNKIVKDSTDNWSNYIRGVVKEYAAESQKIEGFNIIIGSSLPMGSGMSSSAALEVGIAKFIQEAFKIDFKRKKTVELNRRAENDFVGVRCGYLDQFSVLYGKEGNAIFLNFEDLSYEYIPFDLKENTILIIDSKEERNLSETSYNKRMQECSNALVEIAEL